MERLPQVVRHLNRGSRQRKDPDSEYCWSRHGPSDTMSQAQLGTWVGGETEAQIRKGLGLIVVDLRLEPKPLDS